MLTALDHCPSGQLRAGGSDHRGHETQSRSLTPRQHQLDSGRCDTQRMLGQFVMKSIRSNWTDHVRSEHASNGNGTVRLGGCLLGQLNCQTSEHRRAVLHPDFG